MAINIIISDRVVIARSGLGSKGWKLELTNHFEVVDANPNSDEYFFRYIHYFVALLLPHLCLFVIICTWWWTDNFEGNGGVCRKITEFKRHIDMKLMKSACLWWVEYLLYVGLLSRNKQVFLRLRGPNVYSLWAVIDKPFFTEISDSYVSWTLSIILCKHHISINKLSIFVKKAPLLKYKVWANNYK